MKTPGWDSTPYVPLQADSLYVVGDVELARIRREAYAEAYAEGHADGWQDAPRDTPHHRGAGFAVAILVGLAFGVGLFVGVRLATAAPRSAVQPVIPAATSETAARETGGVASGNLAARPSGAPQRHEEASGPAAPQLVVGIASWVSPRYGSTYLALPDGPGHTVRICGRAACVTRTSTDAGPARFLQRQGRIADLSHADFARVCGCSPELVGLTHVTVSPVGPAPTPPATDR